MHLFKDIGSLMTLASLSQKDGRRPDVGDLSQQLRSAIIVHKGCIEWIGSQKNIPKEYRKKIKKETSLKNKTVMPAFVECHTHSIFAGNRSAEFEMRMRGQSYQEISAQGGGILSTMRATRKATQAELTAGAQKTLNSFAAQGVGVVEIKSGYALNLKDELKMLRAAQSLRGPLTVTTFLGAHALPPEFHERENYLDYLASDCLPRIKKQKLSSRVDIFIEKGFFEIPSAKKFLERARDLGFQLTIHADQLSRTGAAILGVELGALSVDHVICATDSDCQRIANSSVTAVLLPTADLYMKCPYPPARKLLDAGARVALATDFNPGSSPSVDLNLVGLLARLEMHMTFPEVVAAYTFNAAAALGVEGHYGTLEKGKVANFQAFDDDINNLFFKISPRHDLELFVSGKKVLV